MLIGQFKFQARQPYARRSSLFPPDSDQSNLAGKLLQLVMRTRMILFAGLLEESNEDSRRLEESDEDSKEVSTQRGPVRQIPLRRKVGMYEMQCKICMILIPNISRSCNAGK